MRAGATVGDKAEALSALCGEWRGDDPPAAWGGGFDLNPAVLIEVGAAAYTSSQLTRAILEDMDMTTIPLLVVSLPRSC